jgi:hypothetical protein
MIRWFWNNNFEKSTRNIFEADSRESRDLIEGFEDLHE